jgi:phosphatidylglycerol:prolipoprotein diacylglycerol transferase
VGLKSRRSLGPRPQQGISVILAIAFPPLDPVLVQIGPFALRWYALAYIAGLVIGWRLLRRIVARPGWLLTPLDIDDLLTFATFGVILGGRIGYVLFYQGDYYLTHPHEILYVWRGGMSFHGGLIGVLTAAAIFARMRRVPFLEVGDALATVTPIGLFFGRLANFINSELWGRVTDVPWGVIFPNGGPLPRHPSQLYEAALEGVLLFCIVSWLAWKPRDPLRRGLLSGVFLTGYALCRIFVELFRQPDVQLGFLVGGLTMGQILSLPMLLAGLWLIWRSTRPRPALAP